ncbi:MAG: hypothetical protein FJ312_07735 [SAR202 cluster bacterium]|nr:hypothetical protein [SAR202 cluster bacterium]
MHIGTCVRYRIQPQPGPRPRPLRGDPLDAPGAAEGRASAPPRRPHRRPPARPTSTASSPASSNTSPPCLAAFGLLLVKTLLQNERWSTFETGNRLCDIGCLYLPRGHRDPSDAQALSQFVRLFVAPILDQLARQGSADDLIRAVLLR